MIGFSVRDNILQVGTGEITFPYRIWQAKELFGLLIVVLAIPPDSSDIDNIFAVNQQCEIVWQIQSRYALDKSCLDEPYTCVSVRGDCLMAVSYFGKRYLVNPETGTIIGRDRNGREW